jgi:hypothetical protein
VAQDLLAKSVASLHLFGNHDLFFAVAFLNSRLPRASSRQISFTFGLNLFQIRGFSSDLLKFN